LKNAFFPYEHPVLHNFLQLSRRINARLKREIKSIFKS
jgi:hypothetical protein